MMAPGAYTDAEASLLRDHAIHIIRCSLPIPGTINIYFIKEPVPTLIDVPAAGDSFLDELDRGLQAAGCSLGDIRRILITHPHFDHYGAAREIVNRTGAEMWVSREGAHWIEERDEEYDRREDQRLSLLWEWGVPAPDREAVIRYYREANCFRKRAKPSRRLSAGETLILGKKGFVVIPVPGHTPFCVMFYSAEGRIAFTGDFLPVPAPGNGPLVQWRDASLQSYRTTSAYVSSLKEARSIDLNLALPGHGPVIVNPSKRIERLLSTITRRREEILKGLGRAGKTAFQITRDVFPGTPRESLFRAVSDVVGHLEVLEDEGVAARGATAPFLFTRV
jgi:glyoxylase-like metal-dependent hydrolase (beta-lactamase superfamily II)